MFKDERHEVIDERLIEYFMTLDWFKSTFESDKSTMKKYFRQFDIIRVQRNEQIMQKGSIAEDFFILIEGKVSVVQEIELPQET